jgi:DNA-binding NarL/FixJ family response regulator
MNPQAQILIAHHSPLLAAGIASALNWDCQVHTAPSGSTAALLAKPGQQPDVLIADHDTAVDWLSRARAAHAAPARPPRCLVIGAQLRGWLVRRALEQGAHGYIDVQCDLQEIATAVRSVSQGQRYLCAAASACIADSFTQETLTPREMQVLGLICEGLGNKSIASRLDIALGTVKAHVRTVLDKLGAASRTQAAAAARRQGLVGDTALNLR